jgi:hypothetical protein
MHQKILQEACQSARRKLLPFDGKQVSSSQAKDKSTSELFFQPSEVTAVSAGLSSNV